VILISLLELLVNEVLLRKILITVIPTPSPALPLTLLPPKLQRLAILLLVRLCSLRLQDIDRRTLDRLTSHPLPSELGGVDAEVEQAAGSDGDFGGGLVRLNLVAVRIVLDLFLLLNLGDGRGGGGEAGGENTVEVGGAEVVPVEVDESDAASRVDSGSIVFLLQLLLLIVLVREERRRLSLGEVDGRAAGDAVAEGKSTSKSDVSDRGRDRLGIRRQLLLVLLSLFVGRLEETLSTSQIDEALPSGSAFLLIPLVLVFIQSFSLLLLRTVFLTVLQRLGFRRSKAVVSLELVGGGVLREGTTVFVNLATSLAAYAACERVVDQLTGPYRQERRLYVPLLSSKSCLKRSSTTTLFFDAFWRTKRGSEASRLENRSSTILCSSQRSL
jgi:hypothetical protein